MRGYFFFVIAFIIVISSSFIAREKHRLLDKERLALDHAVRDVRQSLRILEAEWSLLSAPWRIAFLNERYLFLRHGPKAWDEEALVPTDHATSIRETSLWAQRDCAEGEESCQ
ncbi:MAG: hypothetical protein GDA54_05425 [Alphaproteobacteria bacterium GM7ARS4]|nr:hypothetical protein [Alphaproteobacteria bacterium GM7ARS4]